jgi:hypothetical protein
MNRITKFVARGGSFWIGLYGLSAAFITYFSMYAFRKPFAVGTYENIAGWEYGIDFKVAIVIAQVFGYALSKMLGIKVNSEANPNKRPYMIVGMISLSLIFLVAFAIVPAPLKIVAIFGSGLPLGMIWGLVYSYLEGRRISDILGAGLTVSFIVSSGVVKSVGRSLVVEYGVPELWMPALTGAIFFPIMLLSVFFLAQTPPPTQEDKDARMERTPMFHEQRISFIKKTGFGLLMLVVTYVVLTALRDFRDNFAVEIWGALGFENAPSILSLTELPVALFVMVMFSITTIIKENTNAVLIYHLMIIGGAMLVFGATLAFQAHLIGPISWMILIGAGIYTGYVPYNSVLVDRLTAAVHSPGNAAFVMYLADATGYAGSVGLLLFKNFGTLKLSWLNFFINACIYSSIAVSIFAFLSFLYFKFRVFKTQYK